VRTPNLVVLKPTEGFITVLSDGQIMNDEERRDVLRILGLAGAVGLAGCQGRGSDESETTDSTRTAVETDTTTRETETETTERTTAEPASIDAEVTTGDGERTSVVVVTGRVTHPAGIDSVSVEAGDGGEQIEVDGATEYALDAAVDVAGGQSYEVRIVATGTDATEVSETVETGYVPKDGDAMATDRLVGAHYYPWYEMHGGHQNWTDRTPSDPLLGEYAADDSEVIDRHLDWCLDHGIRWLSASWWGPDSGSDAALKGAVLDAERADEMQFSILYETPGRLEEFDFDLDRSRARERLREDFEYLEAAYFGRDNYLRMYGRPVVFFYIAHALRGDVAGAFEEAARNLDADPYVLADVPFGAPPDAHPVTQAADAVTTYNPYSPRSDIEEVFHDLYERGNQVMHLGAEAADVDFVPAVIPGFDDTELPDSQRPDHPVLSPSPERYERVAEQVAPHLGDAQAVLVTSFNEWYEDTQIEPGEDYGTEYLELTANRLATGESPGYSPEGVTFKLDFNKTIVPAEVNPESDDTRRLSFAVSGLRFLDGDEELVAYDIGTPGEEPLFVEGTHGAASNDDETWRWLGGQFAEATTFVETDVSSADRAILTGFPMRSGIEADVFFDGEKTDRVVFGERDGFDPYELSLESGG
jgi:hypothetical protein